MTSRISIEPFSITEKRVVPFDFASQMVAGQTIGSSVAVSSVYSGTDTTPDIVNGATSNSGTIVSVTLGGDTKVGTLGVVYDVLVTATLATPTEIKTMAAYIAFVPTLPAAQA